MGGDGDGDGYGYVRGGTGDGREWNGMLISDEQGLLSTNEVAYVYIPTPSILSVPVSMRVTGEGGFHVRIAVLETEPSHDTSCI